jgi:hypothetical protein
VAAKTSASENWQQSGEAAKKIGVKENRRNVIK